MSQENYKQDAARWFRQAKADIKAAKGSLKNSSHEWACFQAQQAAEKGVKALWYYCLFEPWGHSVFKLMHEFPKEDIREELKPFYDLARELDKLYIPTRYPNGLPDLTPSDVFTRKEAGQAINSSEKVIKMVASIIESDI
ncbi:MAG: HEPN domain-containing protein [Candidatus Humimicrobiaceae bacterium]